jgi:hypothetical protein
MLKRNRIAVIVLIFSLLVVLACGSSNEGVKVTPATGEAAEESSAGEATEEPPVAEDGEESPAAEEPEPNETEATSSTREVFEVGDLIEVKEHTIRLNSIEYQGDMLVANFTVENNGDSDVSVSSMMSFSAKKEDGTKLDQEIFDCEGSGLDGKVLAGDKLRGNICWAGASPDDNIKIYYQSDLFGEGAVVWNAVEGMAEPLDTDTGSTSSAEIFKVGDVIEVQDHTIRLNSIEYQGNVLVANFLIENHGDSDISASSMMSFSAKNKDGEKLEQEIFDCGSSGLDGKILPGDRLRGNICWSPASPDDDIKIYYEANLFGEGAIVWEAAPAVEEPEINSAAELKVDIHEVGDVVQVNNHTIVLNEATFEGDILKANFTVENQGDSDITVSSMMSFSARKRDGSQLEQDLFNCGSSLDGDVLPGDKLKGDICWSGASSDAGIRIYYVAELLDQGAVVWAVE